MFESSANDLTSTDDFNNQGDLFLRDLVEGTTTVISVNGDGTATGNGQSSFGLISADGRYVIFRSNASNLVAGDTNNQSDIFRRDMVTNTTTLVTFNSAGTASAVTGGIFLEDISADGRYVAIASYDGDLVAGDTNLKLDVFVRDMQTGTTRLASVNAAGAAGNNHSFASRISDDGQRIAFASAATNLTTQNDFNSSNDIFVRNLTTNTTSLVSISTSGASGNGFSADPQISANGQIVVFSSSAINLAAVSSSVNNIFARNLSSNTTAVVSAQTNSSTVTGNSDSFFSTDSGNVRSISDDGRYVVFEGRATNLTATTDTNVANDIFVRDLVALTTKLVSIRTDGASTGNNVSESPRLSANGLFVVFRSAASNLVTTDMNGFRDIFVRDLAGERTVLASINAAGTDSGNFNSDNSYINADGSTVAFRSGATDLVTNDTNNKYDAFARYDSAPGQFQFSDAAYSVVENVLTKVITVNRVGGSFGEATVNYATSDGTASSVSSNDYTSASGLLIFGHNETSKTFTISISNDSIHESDETVNLTLSAPTGGTTLGTPSGAVLTITDDDPDTTSTPPPTPTPTPTGNVDLSLTITDSPDPVTVDDFVFYRITVSNNGAANATGVSFTTDPVASTAVSIFYPSNCVIASNTDRRITCTIGNLASGANSVVTISMRPQQTGTNRLRAVVTGNETDPNTANNSATQDTAVVAKATSDLSIIKTAREASYQVGETARFLITVTNNGTANAERVVVEDNLPADTTYNEGQACDTTGGGTATCRGTGNNRSVEFSLIPAGATARVTIRVTVKASAAGKRITNTATVSVPLNPSFDPNPNNNSATATFTTPPANDNLKNAQVISGSAGTVTGSNVGATRENPLSIGSATYGNEPLHAAKPGGKSIWYKWTAPAKGSATFNTENSAFDTLLAVYQTKKVDAIPGVTSSFALVVPVASNDDARAGTRTSSVNFSTETNATYFIAVDGLNGQAGSVNLNYLFNEIKPAPPVTVVTEIYGGKNKAPVACTNNSDPAGICADNFDQGGFFIVTLKGVNFTSNSRVIINGDELKGFDRNGNPVGGSTTFISSTELEAHIPPSPPLDLAKDGQIRVITPVFSGAKSNSIKVSPEAIAAGEYALAANIGVLTVIQLRNAVIPPGQTREVCGTTSVNKPGEEICISFTAFAGNNESLTITPSFFESEITSLSCQALTNSNGFSGGPNENADYLACVGLNDGLKLAQRSFSINSPNFFNNTS